MKRIAIVLALTISSSLIAKDVVVTQKGKAFSIAEITLAPGDSIVFKNDDDTAHNVFSSTEPLKFNLGIQKPGVDSKKTFETAGSTEIRCAIHPKMKLKIDVK